MSVDQFATSLSDKQLACRDYGHSWKPWTAAYEKESKSISRALRCSSCRTVRRQVLDMSGHTIRNAYEYPDGYLAKNVEVGVKHSRDIFRIEAVTRYLTVQQQKAG